MTAVPLVKKESKELYETGDKVLIRKDLQVNKVYKKNNGTATCVLFNSDMKLDNIRIANIEKVFVDSNGYYNLLECTSKWSYTNEMIEGLIVSIENYSKLKKGDKLVISYDETHLDKFNETVVVFDEMLEKDLVAVDVVENGLHYTATFHTSSIEGLLIETKKVKEYKENKKIIEKKEKMEISEDLQEIVSYNILVEKVIFNEPATVLYYRTIMVEENEAPIVSEKLNKVVTKVSGDTKFDKKKGLDVALFKAFNRESGKMLNKIYKGSNNE